MSSSGLSPRQAECVRRAYARMMRDGFPPTVRELARDLGVTHNSVAFSHRGSYLAALEKKGWASHDSSPGARRAWNGQKPAEGRPLARAWRLLGVGWETVGDGQGGVRRIPFCQATPEGLRLAAVLAAPPVPPRRRRKKAAL